MRFQGVFVFVCSKSAQEVSSISKPLSLLLVPVSEDEDFSLLVSELFRLSSTPCVTGSPESSSCFS